MLLLQRVHDYLQCHIGTTYIYIAVLPHINLKNKIADVDFAVAAVIVSSCPNFKYVPATYRPVPGGSRAPPPPPTPDPPPTSNYRVPPAHRFHKYKLRLLYFRMQKLTPYSIKFGGACPQNLLALVPPPQAN